MPDLDDSTAPKPYVFVLMPFAGEFADVYKFGIKGAAGDVGAYAERLDEQIFNEGMLERIFTQISKADVIVADMTGRNPNVFYEVGYAHALGKIVLLLTRDANDIPFDLTHRQHIVYGGSIDTLREELRTRLRWAVDESSRRTKPAGPERFSVRLHTMEIPPGTAGADLPTLQGEATSRSFLLPLLLRNESPGEMLTITHVYLFSRDDAGVVPCTAVGDYSAEYTSGGVNFWGMTGRPIYVPQDKPSLLDSFEANPVDAADGLSKQYRLPLSFANVPTGASEMGKIDFMFESEANSVDAPYRLRFHTGSGYHDYAFRLQLTFRGGKDKGAEEDEQADG